MRLQNRWKILNVVTGEYIKQVSAYIHIEENIIHYWSSKNATQSWIWQRVPAKNYSRYEIIEGP